MDLNAYLVILWRRRWIVIVAVVVAMIAAVAGVLLVTPTYEASTTLRAALRVDDADDLGYEEVLYADRLLNTFPSIITSGPMRAELEQRLDGAAAPRIAVQFPAESELMLIVTEDPDPELAARSANILAELFMEGVRASPTDRALNITLIDPAVPPRSPSSPRKGLYLALGAVLGLAGGLGLAFLFENLDTTLYSAEQIEAAVEARVLARIPQVREGERVVFPAGDSPQGDGFRRLQTNLVTSYAEQPLRTLMVTSAEPGEGKSTVVANLAQVIAKSGREVLVVDCNLRLPVLHTLFEVSNDLGLSSILEKAVPSSEAIQTSQVSRVRVLTSGPLPSDPTQLFTSLQMSRLVEQLATQFDAVLLDTAALLPFVDAAAIAPSVDGTLLVVQRARVRREDLQSVAEQLSMSRANIVGIAVNRTKGSTRSRYYVQRRSDGGV